MKKTLICTAVACACSTAYAEQIFELGQIEVIEHANEISSAVIDLSQLRQNEIRNVAQVAKLTPGVTFQRGGGRGEQNLLVRGFDARRVPVFIDGIPVYVPYDGNMDLGRFTTFDLAEINISKGASSVLYGANTMGGAVNLVTRKPSQPLEGSIGYGYRTGSNSHTDSHQSYFDLGSKQDKFYAQISGSVIENKGLQLSQDYQANSKEDGGRAENSQSRDRKLSLRVGYTPNASDEYTLSYSTQHGDKHQAIYTGSGKSRYWHWPVWDKESLYFLSHTEFAGGQYYLNTKLFHDTFKNNLDMYNDNTFTTKSTSYYRDYSYGAGVELGAKLTTENILKLSALYKNDVHREHDNDDPTARDEDRLYSLGAENSYQFTQNTKLTFGASYDYRKAVNAENYQIIRGKTYGMYQFDLGNQHAFNYQAKISHKLTENDEVGFSYAHKTHLPTMKERYSRSLRRNRLPNPFLKPEKADHFELSYARNFGDKVKLEGAVFYSRVKDAINEIAVNATEVQNQNVDKTTYKGVELGITTFVSDDLTLGANYSYIRAKNADHNIAVTDLPQHKFFAYADWKISPEWSLYLSQSAESGRYNLVNKKYEKLSGWGTTDAKVTYAFDQHLSLDAGVSNIFDKNYSLTEGYAEEGRVYFTNIKYTF